MELQITDDKVLEAMDECPESKELLSKLFPGVKAGVKDLELVDKGDYYLLRSADPSIAARNILTINKDTGKVYLCRDCAVPGLQTDVHGCVVLE